MIFYSIIEINQPYLGFIGKYSYCFMKIIILLHINGYSIRNHINTRGACF